MGFDYNPAGQITERTDTGGSFAFSGHTDQTSIYDHNALNQIIDITESGAVTRTLTPQWTDGNLTSDGERSFGYDPFNRLSSVTGGGQSDVDLDYDPLGRLAELDVTGGLVTRFQYDGAAMIAETDSAGDVMRRYVHGPGLDAPLVRYDYDGSGALEGRRWLLADERGSIYAHSDEAGAIIQINTYDEYGRPGDSNQGRFGYTGQIWLAEAGLYHYKARAYHAELGVFMQSDPIGHSGGINLYAYVGGDPVNFTDPWGLACEISYWRRWKIYNDGEKVSEGATLVSVTVPGCDYGGGIDTGGDFGGGGGGAKSQGQDGECSGDFNVNERYPENHPDVLRSAPTVGFTDNNLSFTVPPAPGLFAVDIWTNASSFNVSANPTWGWVGKVPLLNKLPFWAADVAETASGVMNFEAVSISASDEAGDLPPYAFQDFGSMQRIFLGMNTTTQINLTLNGVGAIAQHSITGLYLKPC